jgi:hypothetical protein
LQFESAPPVRSAAELNSIEDTVFLLLAGTLNGAGHHATIIGMTKIRHHCWHACALGSAAHCFHLSRYSWIYR